MINKFLDKNKKQNPRRLIDLILELVDIKESIA